ncbi:hypothetical protein MsAg5_05060 [Methanosarcinaceae archaeon Ag5]|uniref:Type II toxin-antitoxin system PemK/MazF family toxin n=1 Tax=Methanolapillus africanus TaxID=3028297 RepID=A0AAE4MII7_9EURY|nr:hypothetical protein [Methanosarcinaceae archaeon Ag5]
MNTKKKVSKVISERQGLLFVPPKYIDGRTGTKKRPMLVVKVNSAENEISLVNITSAEGKAKCFFREDHIRIRQYEPPFIKPSYAKTSSLYVLEYFQKLDSLILYNGAPLNDMDFKNILEQIKDTNVVKFTESELRAFNEFN